jgi:hypothetical protein
MLSICPDAQIVDICHTVRKYAIRDGAFILRATLPYLPVGTHVAVVDPGVGTERRPIGLRVERGDVLVGPDNGLLSLAWEALGGARRAFAIESDEFSPARASATKASTSSLDRSASDASTLKSRSSRLVSSIRSSRVRSTEFKSATICTRTDCQGAGA